MAVKPAHGTVAAQRLNLGRDFCSNLKMVINGMTLFPPGHTTLLGYLEFLRRRFGDFQAREGTLTLEVTSTGLLMDGQVMLTAEVPADAIYSPLFLDGVTEISFQADTPFDELEQLCRIWSISLNPEPDSDQTFTTRCWEVGFGGIRIVSVDTFVELLGDEAEQELNGLLESIETQRSSGPTLPRSHAAGRRLAASDVPWLRACGLTELAAGDLDPEPARRAPSLAPLEPAELRALVDGVESERRQQSLAALAALAHAAPEASESERAEIVASVAAVLVSVARAAGLEPVRQTVSTFLETPARDATEIDRHRLAGEVVRLGLGNPSLLSFCTTALASAQPEPAADAILGLLPRAAAGGLLDCIARAPQTVGESMLPRLLALAPGPDVLGPRIAQVPAHVALPLLEYAKALAPRDRVAVFIAAIGHGREDVRHMAAMGVPRSELAARPEALYGLLDDPDPELRQMAVSAVLAAKDDSTAPYILRLLAHTDLPLAERRRAIRALGGMGTLEVITALRKEFRSQTDIATRATCAVALGQAGDEFSRELLETTAAGLLVKPRLKEACEAALRALDERKARAGEAGARASRTASDAAASDIGAKREALWRSAQAAAQAGDRPRAIALLQRIPADSEYLLEATAVLAELLVAGGQAEQACERVRATLGAQPVNPETVSLHYWLAVAEEAAGRADRAFDIQQQIEAAQPAYRDVGERLKRLARSRPRPAVPPPPPPPPAAVAPPPPSVAPPPPAVAPPAPPPAAAPAEATGPPPEPRSSRDFVRLEAERAAPAPPPPTQPELPAEPQPKAPEFVQGMLLSWAMHFVGEALWAQCGSTVHRDLVLATHQEALRRNPVLAVFQVSDSGSVEFAATESRLPREAVAAMAEWIAHLMQEAQSAAGTRALLDVRAVTSVMGPALEQVGFYAALATALRNPRPSVRVPAAPKPVSPPQEVPKASAPRIPESRPTPALVEARPASPAASRQTFALVEERPAPAAMAANTRAGARSAKPVALVIAVLGLAALAFVGLRAHLAQAPPVITRISPATAAEGDSLAVEGSGFAPTSEHNSVRFGDVRAVVTSVAADRLQVTVPALGATAGDVTVSVETAGGRSNGSGFRLRTRRKADSLVPEVATAGDTVSVRGTFGPDGASVDVAGTAAEIVAQDERAVNFRVPSLALEPGATTSVRIRTSDGESVLDLVWGHLPLLRAVAPAAAAAGETVTIRGLGFAAQPTANQVTFSGVRALVVTASPTALQVIVPGFGVAVGPARVRVETAGSEPSDEGSFTLTPPVSPGLRFFAAAAAPGQDQALVSTALGPLLLLSSRDDAASAAARAVQVAALLNEWAALPPTTPWPGMEYRSTPRPGLALEGRPAAAFGVTPEDAIGYEVPPGLRGTGQRPTLAALGARWAALLNDLTGLTRGKRPVHSGAQPAVIDALLAESGWHPGNPLAPGFRPSDGLRAKLAEWALRPAGEGARVPGAVLAGSWQGAMTDTAGTRHGLLVAFRVEGKSVVGTLLVQGQKVAADGREIGVSLPLQDLSTDGKTVRFVTRWDSGDLGFAGRVLPNSIEGTIHKGRNGPANGTFELEYVR